MSSIAAPRQRGSELLVMLLPTQPRSAQHCIRRILLLVCASVSLCEESTFSRKEVPPPLSTADATSANFPCGDSPTVACHDLRQPVLLITPPYFTWILVA